MVTYTDFDRPDPKLDAKTMVKAVADSVAKTCTEKERKEITQNGLPGIELVGEIEQKGPKIAMTYRVFYVNDRLYQLMVVNAMNTKEKPLVKKFLDSFKLLKKKDAKEPKKDKE